MNLAVFIEDFIRDFVDNPAKNNLGPADTEGHFQKAWAEALVGFSRGDDVLYQEMKDHVGPFHWTPEEAFAIARSHDTTASNIPGKDLTVVSWALCHTEESKRSNREQTFYPSERWARARIFGQTCSRALQSELVDALAALGHPAIAPSAMPEFAEPESPQFGIASSWSERHVAYVSGLGTFGLSGGLITKKGQAARFCSIIVLGDATPTPRLYDDPFAYCLFYARGTCALCARRCPSGSVAPSGRDKNACARHLKPGTARYVQREYGFEGYGCGLCQTGVPCESGIPNGLAR